jgi:hypothetical protein
VRKKEEILRFKNKKELFGYLKEIFNDSQIILIHGSTALVPVKNFSDFDIEVYGKVIKKPHYEIAFIGRKPVLITAYFYRYQKGKNISVPKTIQMIKGKYTDKVAQREPQTKYSEGKYGTKEKMKRECQLVTDFCFKYFRSKETKYLKYIQKRII